MANDPMKRLRENASDLAGLSRKSASVSADMVAEYDEATDEITTHVTYSAVMVIDGVKRHVHGSKTTRDAALSMYSLMRVEAIRTDAKQFGYALVRLPDADDQGAGQ